MDNPSTTQPPSPQLQLIQLVDVDNARFIDPLEGWDLNDVRALALDPDVQVRRLAALSNWNWDIRLQRVLACDPDLQVVLNLLSRVDPPVEIARMILRGPHVAARRCLAARNLVTELLVEALSDTDEQVRHSAGTTLQRRNVVQAEVVA